MAKEITSSVEALEVQAEGILEQARAKASEIVLQSRDEAKRVLSSELALDEVKAECQKIVSNAKVEAGKRIKDSESKSAEISASADKKAKEITDLLVNIVRGQS